MEQMHDDRPNGVQRRMPANYDHRFPPEKRLEILETLVRNGEAGEQEKNGPFLLGEGVTSINLNNWRTQLRSGTLVPDPEKHPRLVARLATASGAPAKVEEAPAETPREQPEPAPVRTAPRKKARRPVKPSKPAKPAKAKSRTKKPPLKVTKTQPVSPAMEAADLLSSLVGSVRRIEEENEGLVLVLTSIRDICNEALRAVGKE